MAQDLKNSGDAGKKLVGCCGAYCGTCKELERGFCKGCKLGYAEGERDISKAKCAIKVCCFGKRKRETCADCPRFAGCAVLKEFYGKNGYKYGKYKESLEFIKKEGYPKFLEKAEGWKGPYGKFL